MRSLILVAVLLPTPSSAGYPQQSPYRTIRVQSCPAADDVLGELGDDRRANVRGFYAEDTDQTWLTTGRFGDVRRSPYYFNGHLTFFGKDPIAPSDSVNWQAAVPTVTMTTRGRDARELLDAGSAPSAMLILDDSVTVVLGTATLGRYEGPPERAMAPVTLALRYDRLVQLLRAKRIEVHLADDSYEMSRDERRDLRGLFRVAVCSGAIPR